MIGLPGSYHGKEETNCCDCGKVAECSIIQGETDSFGYETNSFCNDCLKKMREERKTEENECDWCKKVAARCCWTRDIDEGMYGPAYLVCPSCYRKQQDWLIKEAEEHWRNYDY